MSFSRKLARKQQARGHQAALGTTLSQIGDQAQSLNKLLASLPQQMQETKQLLDSLVEDYQTLADELEVTQYILRRAASLTPEQEQGYRADYREKKDRG